MKLLASPRKRDMNCQGWSRPSINGLLQEGVGPSLSNREV